jgi:hypothetical protein
MSGKTPGGGHHESSNQGSGKDTNVAEQGAAGKAAQQSAEAHEAEMERTQPEMSEEDRQRFGGTAPSAGGDGPGPRRTSSTRAGRG